MTGACYSPFPSCQVIKKANHRLFSILFPTWHLLDYYSLAKLVQNGFIQLVFYILRILSSMNFWCFNHYSEFDKDTAKSLTQGIHRIGIMQSRHSPKTNNWIEVQLGTPEHRCHLWEVQTTSKDGLVKLHILNIFKFSKKVSFTNNDNNINLANKSLFFYTYSLLSKKAVVD